MKNKSIINFNNFINKTILIFTILFTIILSIFGLVQFIVFNQQNFNIGDILFAILVIFLLSVPLGLFYEINRITVFLQIIITYITITLIIYTFGFLLGWFSLENISFIITSLTLNILGGLVLTIIILVKRNLEVRDLNRNLNQYKGREKR